MNIFNENFIVLRIDYHKTIDVHVERIDDRVNVSLITESLATTINDLCKQNLLELAEFLLYHANQLDD